MSFVSTGAGIFLAVDGLATQNMTELSIAAGLIITGLIIKLIKGMN